MHGRIKVRTTAEELVRKQKERAEKLVIYKDGLNKVFNKKENEHFDNEALSISGQILVGNPDIYTMWNLRKQIIVHMSEQNKLNEELTPEMNQSLFDNELTLTENCLRINPKSYGAWHHRCWILNNCPVPDWKKELSLCTKFLKLDERNFHCWDHRRHVVACSLVSPLDELEFSTEKIHDNFSNYSSWHYRSKLLPVLYPDEEEERQIKEEKLKEELEMVQNAAFTDPNDSSAWFYQRWLLGKADQKLDIVLAELKPTTATIALTKPANCNGNTNYKLQIVLDNVQVDGIYECKSDYLHDTVWMFSPSIDISKMFKMGNLAQIHLYYDHEIIKTIDLQYSEGRFLGVKALKFGAQFGEGVKTELQSQLESCQQLLEMDPDSKWTLLTTALTMRALDNTKHHQASLELLVELRTVDPLRAGYYSDLRSKWIMENIIENWLQDKQNISKGSISFKDLGLTTLYHRQYLCLASTIDIRGNTLNCEYEALCKELTKCNIII